MKPKPIALKILATLVLLSIHSMPAAAANTTQDFTLNAGWNSIFLEIEPDDANGVTTNDTNPEVVFASILDYVESVWAWNPRTGTVEFIKHPNEARPSDPLWMVYLPNDPIITNLYAIHANTAYLIKMKSDTPLDTELIISGEATMPRIDWKSDSFNFVGFHLTDNPGPFFANFFSTSPAHKDQAIYLLDNSGVWTPVDDPGTSQNEALTMRMKKGEGFWIYCNGYSEFTGPLSIQIGQGSGLHYGKTLNEQDLEVFNNSATDTTTITLALESSNVPLYYWVFDPANDVAGWEPFPPGPLSIQGKASQKLRLGVKRAGLTAGTLYATNMTITDNEGMTIRVPVSVTGIDYAGLWVGYATVNKVSEPANGDDPDRPVKTGSEFSFRLIVHAEEGTGKVRLLSQVVQMWQEGTWRPDPDDPDKMIVDEPGHFVLFTDDALIPSYSGAAMRDGRFVGRRISTPVFPCLTADQGELTGSAVSGGAFNPSVGNDLSLTVTLEADNPTNPFLHRYHPDHKIPEEQSYKVIRTIKMTFSDEDSEGRPITGVPSLNWGGSEVGGLYEEIIGDPDSMEGKLHKNLIYIEGTFVLHKVSRVATLTQ
jgi:hypothetical protein